MSFNAKSARVALFLGAAASALMATAAIAADEPNAPAATTVPEVTITAQRRTESLQKVPIAATVLTGSQLKDQGVDGVQQLQNMTPGLSIQPPESSETFINIRGVGLQQTNPASSNGVAFYVDGVYVPTLIDTVDTFYDLSNVEVLRGPQGTLVGSNSDGGAIFVNSAQPTFDHPKGYFEETIGDYNRRRSEGALNMPLTDYLAARVAFVYETRDSYDKNIGASAPNTPGNVDYEAVRLQLAFKPSDSFEATARYEPYQSRTDGFAVKPDELGFIATNPGSVAYDPVAAALQNQPRTLDYNLPQYYNISGQRSSLNAVWHINSDIEIKSVTAYQTGYESDQTDIDAAAANLTETRRASFNTFTQELNLLSTSSSPFQWVVGAYYLDSKKPLQLQFTNPPPLNSVGLNLVSDQTNEAVFGSGTYTFTPQWSLTLGARYSHDDLPFHEELCTGFPQPCGNYDTSDNETTGTAKLAWQATTSTLVYGSVSSGYKAGGYNLQIPDIGFTPPPFKPETNVVEELGVKTTLDDRHLRIDADVFDSQYDNYQLQEFLGGLPATQGPGKADIYGAEAEFLGQFSDLEFNVGAAYLHGTVTSNFAYLAPTGPTTITSGTGIPYAPEWAISAGIQYDFHVLNGRLTPRVQYQYQAAQYNDITYKAVPGPDQVIPAHSTWDFRLTYAAPEHWSLEGYVTNFTNSVYLSGVNANPQPAPAELSYGPPREFGARLSYRF